MMTTTMMMMMMMMRGLFGPSWAVGALFRGARCIHINRICEIVFFHIISLSLRSRDIIVR